MASVGESVGGVGEFFEAIRKMPDKIRMPARARMYFLFTPLDIFLLPVSIVYFFIDYFERLSLCLNLVNV